MKQFYEQNADFKRYVDESRRIKHADMTIDEFLDLAITKEVAKMYMSNTAVPEVQKSTYNPVGECV